MNASQRFAISFVAYIVYFVLLFIGLGVANSYLEAQAMPTLEAMPGWLGLLSFAFLVIWPLPVMFYIFYHTPAWKKHLLKTGRLAVAQVLSIKDTGVSSGSGLSASYYIDLLVRVMPQGEAPFEGQVEIATAVFNLPSPGDPLMVRYDPINHQHIVQAKDIPAASVVPDQRADLSAFTARMEDGRTRELADELKKLEGMHQSGSLTDDEFRLARKKLLA